MMVNIDQERAKKAWEFVKEAKGKEKEKEKEVKFDSYTNLAKSAPALVVSNGLMQTLAFFKGKTDKHYQLLADQVVKWVCERVYEEECSDFSTLMNKLTSEEEMPRYMLATEEALEILKWIRHFAPTMK